MIEEFGSLALTFITGMLAGAGLMFAMWVRSEKALAAERRFWDASALMFKGKQ